MTINKYSHNLNDFKPHGVKITHLRILPYNKHSTTPRGGIATFLEPPQLNLNEDNAKLNHEPYKWEITIKAIKRNHAKNFTVRLFIAPAVLIEDQRSWIEMDKFTHSLTYSQRTIITTIIRRDVESSVARKVNVSKISIKKRPNLSLCGWPQRMMLPVGKSGGTPYVAFAMLTNDTLLEVGTYNSYICTCTTPCK